MIDSTELIQTFEENFIHVPLHNEYEIEVVTEDLLFRFTERGFICIDYDEIEYTLSEMDERMKELLASSLISFMNAVNKLNL